MNWVISGRVFIDASIVRCVNQYNAVTNRRSTPVSRSDGPEGCYLFYDQMPTCN